MLLKPRNQVFCSLPIPKEGEYNRKHSPAYLHNRSHVRYAWDSHLLQAIDRSLPRGAPLPRASLGPNQTPPRSRLWTLSDHARSTSQLVGENVFLRKPLIILRRQVKRPARTKTDRILLVLLASMGHTCKQAHFTHPGRRRFCGGIVRAARSTGTSSPELFLPHPGSPLRPEASASNWQGTIACGEHNIYGAHDSRLRSSRQPAA